MFDLETSIAAWRRSLETNPAFNAEDVEELERHIRDEVVARVGAGMSAKDAFRSALEGLGHYGEVESEYRKVYWQKRIRHSSLGQELTIRLAMLRNYLRVVFRTMKRQKGLSAANIIGLSLGLAGCLLLTSFVLDELRYDSFHQHADQIVRVTTKELAAGGTPYAHTFPAAGPTLVAEMPEVLAATRILRSGFSNHDVLGINDRRFMDPAFLYVDGSFFDVFTVDTVEGALAALARPNAAVVTSTAAQAFFGDRSAIGEVVTFPDVDQQGPAAEFEIVGVVEGFPPHSHFHFDILLSLETWNQGRTAGYFDNNWRVFNSYTYLRLAPGTSMVPLEAKLSSLVAVRSGSDIPEALRVDLRLQPLTDIHLHSRLAGELEANGDVRTVVIIGVLALFLLLISGINFINLSTARAVRRAAEVGVRKVMGAHRAQLVRQFLTESLLASAIATFVALAIYVLFLPTFNALSGKFLTPLFLLSDWTPAFSVFSITLFIGFAAGSYPAFVLSSFRPAVALKSGILDPRSRGAIRRGLVVTQFALSIGLMIATVVIYRQLDYMQNASLGYEKEHLLVLDYPFREADTSRADALRQELLRHPGVQVVSFGSMWPTRSDYWTVPLRPGGAPGSARIAAMWTEVDERYPDVLGLQLVRGRGFTGRRTDSAAVHVNEAAVRAFGWDDAIGKNLYFAEDDAPLGTVIGVVRDFNYRSLVDPVEPVVLASNWQRGRYPIVKLSLNRRDDALTHIESAWDRLLSDQTFEVNFLDASYDALYRAEQRLSRTSGIFAILALTIACLGLFGLAAFTIQQRTKEIGLRKILGATTASITGRLTGEFVRLVAIAFIIAVPVAYVAVSRWLEGFAFRVEIGPSLFLLAGGVAMASALVTVAYQAVRAGMTNPARSLRYE